jgi:ADP-ribose pyrophosphatase YjhB (NUDIX family)
MADQSAPSAGAVEVYVCAVIGREDEVLLARRPAGDWGLPGTQVGGGEWVADELARGVREVVGVGVGSASFLCVIEDRDGLVLVFDVIPDDEANLPDPAPADGQSHLAWIRLDQLDTLQLWPQTLRHGLTTDNPPWLGHDWPTGNQ